VHPNAGIAPEKPVFSHLSDEKLGQGGFWRRDDGYGRAVKATAIVKGTGIATEIGSCNGSGSEIGVQALI
jgi:hypothetical protein